MSASMGLYARGSYTFTSIVSKQFIIGILLGGSACFIASRIQYRFWKKHAFMLFIISLLFTISVFIPGFGIEHGGATRWVNIFGFSFQPAELLKLGFVIYLSAWLSGVQQKIHTYAYGLIPIVFLLSIVGGILALQPDLGTVLVIVSATGAIFIVAGARMKDIVILFAVGLCAGILLIAVKPYVLERVLTFINPARDSQGSSYQIQQSLIAIGSGEITGRGFGQSVQKFDFLPEPVGDSIFAVAAEEFGFIGSVGIILLFCFIALRGSIIALRAPDMFGRLLVMGIVILLVAQSFLNIGAMVGVFPLTGMPLLLVSQGGSAILFTLIGLGIVLNVSRYNKKV